MKEKFHRALAWLLCLGILLPLLSGTPARATQTETENEEQEAEDISNYDTITKSVGLPEYGFFDEQRLFGGTAEGDAYFTAEHEKGIGSMYIIFQYEYGPYEVVNNDTGEVAIVGQERFMHQFLDMEEIFGSCPKSVTVRLEEGPVSINDMKIFTPGKVPDYVQIWKSPKENETDLILFSTHADDEHLFFAGILPYYGAELDYEVLVVYLTDHRNFTPIRAHEILNGLWAVGIDTYPVIGDFTDFNRDNIDATYYWFELIGESREELLGYVVEQMRRFKPKVVVAHDFAGEYGHGQHMVYADLVAKALEITNDPEQYPELAEKYGLWDVPKAYFHLYKENEIVMDWDRPLERFDGKSAFEVSVYQGFQKHITQISYFQWFYKGFPDAKSLPYHNPCYFGLYRSTVGPDVEKNDFFENVTTYGQDRQAEEDRLAEEARLQAQAEEEARLEAEEKAKEQALRDAQDRKESEALKEADEAVAKAAKTRTTVLIIMAVMAAGYVLLGCLTRDKKKF